MTPRRQLSFAFIGHTIPILALAAIALTLVLFTRSWHNGDTFSVGGIGSAELNFGSTEGRIMIGVFEQGQRRAWWRPRRASLADLNMSPDDYFGVVVDFWGWGFCVPHLLILALLTIPIIWWFVSFRHRDEHLRRIERGLCMNCGYDVTYSQHRCPECGEVHSNVRWNDQREDSDAPLPPPPLNSRPAA